MRETRSHSLIQAQNKIIPMFTNAPELFRKRLLIEGYFGSTVDGQYIIDFFGFITRELSLNTYGEPLIHTTIGIGKEANQG